MSNTSVAHFDSGPTAGSKTVTGNSYMKETGNHVVGYGLLIALIFVTSLKALRRTYAVLVLYSFVSCQVLIDAQPIVCKCCWYEFIC